MEAMKDEEYMKQAIALAKLGCGYVNPNPMVGAVIVKDDKVIGRGYHQYYGGLHAERNAIHNCKEEVKGATMYVTLEPCCHYGKTPPCTDIIIERGISKVVIGSLDPNELVQSKGIAKLREYGIEVVTGVRREECEELNKVFFHYITTKRPYVIMKYAMTADGKVATRAGLSKWITGECAREHVQQMRHCYQAIMVGIGTVLQDNPMLTCRMKSVVGVNPIRVVCDSSLRIPLETNLVKTAKEIPTIVVTLSKEQTKIEILKKAGVQVLQGREREGKIDLVDLMKQLGQQQIDSVYVEGGGTLHATLLSCDLVDEVHVYMAPKLFGGEQAKTPIGGEGVISPEQAYQLELIKYNVLGEDLLIQYRRRR